MEIVDVERIYINPDCGLKLLPREIAKAKMEVMVKGVNIIREELRRKGVEKIIMRR
jgi:5-methyltetrahydropteroyltriglutamate--homocysteine methyltransferase